MFFTIGAFLATLVFGPLVRPYEQQQRGKVQNLPFIENMEKMIQKASSLLDTSLGHCFVDGLIHKDENAVYNCLRAYATADNTRNTEEIFRSTVVSPLVQKVIPYTSSGVVGGPTGNDLEEDYKQIKISLQKSVHCCWRFLMQKIQVCMYSASLLFQYLRRYFLQSNRESQRSFLLEDLPNS